MVESDPVVARLRASLDELTAGAEPNAAGLVTIGAPRRRWMLPAVAAAAVAIVVGVAVTVAGRGDHGTPAAPSPTGAPVTAARPAESTIPWYVLRADGATADAPQNATGADPLRTQVWATPSFSRVLVAVSSDLPAGDTPERVRDSLPSQAGVIDGAIGHAWMVPTDDSRPNRGYVIWVPDDRTVVNVFAYGFAAVDLLQITKTASVTRDEYGPRVDAPLSSLEPLSDVPSPLELVSQPYTLLDGAEATVMVSMDGPAFALRTYASWAEHLTATHTPFGNGFRLDLPDMSMIWWQVDAGPYWAGVSASAGQIDDLLGQVVRVTDLSVPGVTSPPDGSLMEAAGPPATPPDTVTAPPGTSPGPPIPTNPNEPAMTALMPSSPPGGGWPPTAVGESVMLSVAQALGDRGITVYANEASQARDIAAELERLRDIDAFADVVIIQAGTNGTMTEADLDRMMTAVSEVERVVVLTVHADRSWIAPNNELIRALPTRYPNVSVVDWDQIATENPEILTADGIHVEDRDVYADAIAAAAELG